MSKKTLVRYVFEAVVCAAAVLILLLVLAGCDPGARGFEAIQIAKPLPYAFWLPKEARQSSFGLVFMGVHQSGFPPGMIPHGKLFILRALTGKDGRVLCKTYSLDEAHGWGWLITFDRRLIMEVQIPKRWFRHTPESWPGKDAASRLKASWPEVEKRIRWGSVTAGQDKPAEITESIPGDTIASADELIQAIERAAMPGHAPSCKCAKHHAGLYVMLVHEAVVNLPANQLPSDRNWPKQVLSDHFALLMNMPGVFSHITRTGATWYQRTPDGYTYLVRNTGDRRIHIEIVHGEIQSPCGVSYR
jgi:hypothetical protein